MPKLILKSDKYKKRRGGPSRPLEIFCSACGAPVCLYQKDGPGHLLRMYADRIMDPVVPVSGKNLNCPVGHLLGIAMVYEKENRPAFRLVPGAVAKKIVKARISKAS